MFRFHKVWSGLAQGEPDAVGEFWWRGWASGGKLGGT